MYYYSRPATCTKCGYQCEANGTDDENAIKLRAYTVCPECFEAMLLTFCGYMKPDWVK